MSPVPARRISTLFLRLLRWRLKIRRRSVMITVKLPIGKLSMKCLTFLRKTCFPGPFLIRWRCSRWWGKNKSLKPLSSPILIVKPLPLMNLFWRLFLMRLMKRRGRRGRRLRSVILVRRQPFISPGRRRFPLMKRWRRGRGVRWGTVRLRTLWR